MMTIKLWGVRGSIPCPGPMTMEFGGNTACIELRYGPENKLVIIDAGSGIRALGNSLMQTDLPKGPIKTHIFITHTHWDHIMGFPFFTPIYIPGTKLDIFGPVTYEDDGLDRIIGNQLTYRYFPIKHSELSAEIAYHSLKECSFELPGGMFVITKYLNHPILCLGYRFEFEGKSFCTVYDNEPFRNVFPTDPADPDYDPVAAEEGEKAAREENEKILEFIRNADLVVYDSQYTYKEYMDSKKGWGHSFFENAINSANKANVKEIIFFHHDPLRSDDQLKELLIKYQNMIKNKTALIIKLAKEGDSYTL